MIKDVRNFVEARLAAMHERPAMWAGSKEAFALQVVLLVEIMIGEVFDTQRLLRKMFPGTNTISRDPIDDAWARSVIDIAREELSNMT